MMSYDEAVRTLGPGRVVEIDTNVRLQMDDVDMVNLHAGAHLICLRTPAVDGSGPGLFRLFAGHRALAVGPNRDKVMEVWPPGCRYDMPWTAETVAVVPLSHRIAAVFAHLLSLELSPQEYAAVVRWNRETRNPLQCSSAQFFDSNETMADAYRAVGARPPWDYPATGHGGGVKLWTASWMAATTVYMPIYGEE